MATCEISWCENVPPAHSTYCLPHIEDIRAAEAHFDTKSAPGGDDGDV